MLWRLCTCNLSSLPVAMSAQVPATQGSQPGKVKGSGVSPSTGGSGFCFWDPPQFLHVYSGNTLAPTSPEMMRKHFVGARHTGVGVSLNICGSWSVSELCYQNNLKLVEPGQWTEAKQALAPSTSSPGSLCLCPSEPSWQRLGINRQGIRHLPLRLI